ncbi:MAG TPA: HPr family phosphocarrier protein [Candidatus Limnocylindrales bacterium]
MTSRDVVFRDRYGLHPRAARRIQDSVDGLSASVTLEDLDGSGASIDARGMLALISSGIRNGDRIRITADGADEVAVTAVLGDLFESGVCHPDVRL